MHNNPFFSTYAGVTLFAVGWTASAPCRAESWRDEFTGPKLTPRWTWEAPIPGPTFSFTERPGWLRLKVPQRPGGYNHWTNEKHAALLHAPAPPPDSDWDFSSRIDLAEYAPDSNFHLAMIVGFEGGRVLAWGPFLSRRLYPDWQKPYLWVEPTGQGAYLRKKVHPKNIELRISKRVNTYRFSYRRQSSREWTEVGCWYGGGLTPAFVGFMGKTFGDGPRVALDIDYAALALTPRPEPPPPLDARIRLQFDRTTPIPKYQRGFFLEFLGNCIFRGLWDERLVNRKFIGGDTETGVVWGWAPYGKAEAWAPDRTRPLAEPQSQRVDLADGEAGVVQYGLALRRNRPMRIRVNACGDGRAQDVTVHFVDRAGKSLGTAVLIAGAVPTDWTARECTLTPSEDSDDAGLAVTARGPGRLWLGAVSLMAADNVSGFRREVMELLETVRIPALRWPGGNMASGYDWRDGIGPRDRRPTRWDRAWKAWVYNDMGTDEFLELCRILGAEPCICVNAGEGMPKEAAAWVEYCNGAADTPMGRLRAANGHRSPWKVRWWDVGNEIWGSWQLGHVGPDVYGLRAVEFARAMRRVDPDIQLAASGVFEHDFGDWNTKMLSVCGQTLDLLSVHDYVGYDARQCTDAIWVRVTGAPVRIEQRLRATYDLAAKAAGRPLPLTFDEWNTVAHQARGGHGLVDALYAAGMLHAMQRCGPIVPMANYALLVNVLGALRVSQTAVIETPVFQVFRMFAQHSGPVGIHVMCDAPEFRGVPILDAAASMNEEHRRLHITLVNRHPRRSIRVQIQFDPMQPLGEARISTVQGDEPWARNTFENPRQVCLRTQAVPAQTLLEPIVVPPASILGLSVDICAPGDPHSR